MRELLERPILFSTEMVKAILSDRKTQTRRVIKPQPERLGDIVWDFGSEETCFIGDESARDYLFHEVYGSKGTPYGSVYVDGAADRMWVKETWQAYTPNGLLYSSLSRAEKDQAELYNWAVVDKATSPELKRDCDPWIPSIFMPRWASRITLEITDVRVERIQEITEYQAEMEGVQVSHYYCDEGVAPDFIPTHRCDPIGKFRELWDSINSKRGYSWKSNPWVWVIEFKKVEPAQPQEDTEPDELPTDQRLRRLPPEVAPRLPGF